MIRANSARRFGGLGLDDGGIGMALTGSVRFHIALNDDNCLWRRNQSPMCPFAETTHVAVAMSNPRNSPSPVEGRHVAAPIAKAQRLAREWRPTK
jgi:hypothetical protein